MRRSKYIFGGLKTAFDNMFGAIVFPEACDHAEMARVNCLPGTVCSAGFVELSVDGQGEIVVELVGESTSLKMSADVAHTNAVRRALGLPGR